MSETSNPSPGCSRRSFLRAFGAVPLVGPLTSPRLTWLPDGDDVSLLVLELEGGNDGLNTLIPRDDRAYAKARPQLGSVRGGAHAVGDEGFALHPSMGAMAKLFARGLAAAVHGVGYPDPDRSHFRSRDIWHAADPTFDPLRGATSGWLGRAAAAMVGAPLPAVAVGAARLPLALRSEKVVVPVLERIEDYALRVAGGGDAGREALGHLATTAGDPGDDLHGFLRGVASAAVTSAARLQRDLAAYRPRAEYPGGDLGRDLQLAARVLVSGCGTRLLHVSFGGFDTHAQQLPTHAGLLRQVSDGLAALCADLEAHGRLGHTMILVHSEFGRRVAENGSLGTDHGAAAPVFVLGGGVRAGLHGKPPDLDDLVDGDVRVSTDFRAVYAALLQRLGVEPSVAVAAAPAALDLFA